MGWVVNGPLQGSGVCEGDHLFIYANKISIDRIEEFLVNQYNHDFNEKASTEQEEMLRDDRKFVEIMEGSAQLQNGHYKFQLYLSKGKMLPCQTIAVLHYYVFKV